MSNYQSPAKSKLPPNLTFEEFVQSCAIFFYDPNVEDKFNAQIETQAKQIRSANIGHGKPRAEDILEFILNQGDGLARILGILRIPQEKFMRIVSLVRELEGPVDRNNEREWTIPKIESKIKEDSGHNSFAERMIDVLLNGYKDKKLETSLPLIYRERLRLETLNEYTTEQDLMISLKDQYSASYNVMKGFAIEDRIKEQIGLTHQTYAQGPCALVDRKVDLMIPSSVDPRIVIMSSYDETTSSSQSTRASDMIAIGEALQHANKQRGEQHYFVNVVDGGGWLSRRKDLRRMYDACDFCLNVAYLPQLKHIIEVVVV